MARIRTIKPEFPQSESMGRLSRDARLLFVQLWTIADDDGKTRAASRLLASLLYPYDDDAPALIDGWLAELEAEGCILRYAVDGASYLQVCKWADHQKIDRPSVSKLPCPPGAVVDNSANSTKAREQSRALDADLVSGPSTKDQKTTSGTAAAAPAPRELPIDDPWVPVCEALAGLYGGVSWRDRRTGERLAWVGQSVGILGKHCGADPARALVAVAKFKASDRAKFAPKPRDLPPVLGQWCEAVSPKRADDGAAFDERYHARLDGGRVVLRDPSLTIAALGLACNPHDPATWPPDMRAAYASRIHVSDGREVFA